MQHSETCDCLTDVGCLFLTVFSNLFTIGVNGFFVTQNQCSTPVTSHRLYTMTYILIMKGNFSYWSLKTPYVREYSLCKNRELKCTSKLDEIKFATS